MLTLYRHGLCCLQTLYSDVFMIYTLLAVTRTHFLRFFNNSEAFASELLKNLKKCFFGTIYVAICLVCSNLQPQNSVLSAATGLNYIASPQCLLVSLDSKEMI